MSLFNLLVSIVLVQCASSLSCMSDAINLILFIIKYLYPQYGRILELDGSSFLFEQNKQEGL